ncbi:hypothetical protein MKX03_018923 [Papaver bracteatum]|nr:hypothetical protein MKX03_018923 [Papaver bracteatum]
MANPTSSRPKKLEINCDQNGLSFYDKRISQEVIGDALGDVCSKGFRGHGRRNGERRRKSVRGCIVSQQISVLNMRASKIRKLFNVSKDDDVSEYVDTYRRSFTNQKGMLKSKAPKVQRLVTPLTEQRRRSRNAEKKKRTAKADAELKEYMKLLESRLKGQRHWRKEVLERKRSSLFGKAAAAEEAKREKEAAEAEQLEAFRNFPRKMLIEYYREDGFSDAQIAAFASSWV